ncbi:MAG: hypothetical protein KAI66_02335 [Lentisphaeria bacterium]|nr:hypothetical protein [Lentisphaeria bacterium]
MVSPTLPLSCIRFGVAVCCLLMLVGCIHLEQSIEIGQDQSLRVRYHYSVAEDMAATMETGRTVLDTWQETETAGLNWFTNEAAVRRHFAQIGAEIVHFRGVYRQRGRKHVEFTVEAMDAVTALNSGLFGAFELSAEADGTQRLHSTFPAEKTSDTLSKEHLEALRAFSDDLWLQIRVTIPGEIEATNATKTKGRTAIWTFDPGKDKTLLTRLPSIEMTYRDPK